ncbi:ABC transporter ATP-binding protein [Brucella anthropi]|uniref:ABC transporter ATP-binding protein n=1 Tax=Brucella anthropi TaxID=529 RepID=UPI00244BF93F|nr:ABC transporter ATP-binding protein [Brucella anthropi]MDG9793504.1 ABC transporter ATP-binding protein [Brucella anthropi]MDH0583326.1 ABC transporter ATP-binding protein [Brucella anthropi]MDH0819909.1 ABC transporter ATP-binding protein [Brucella anthropi]MDH2086699.1 ABC transporter ATP-binding protein [Brucella anthropi]
MADVQIKGLTKTYGAFTAVSDMTLDVQEGEFLIFLGPSGCGKTTTLRMLAGFIEPDAGSIRLGNREISQEPPHRRNIGLVFQNYALFPHLTIFENVAFGLRRRKVPEPELKSRVTHALELVDLSHLVDRLPRQLSGGQQQRVAIARAIAIRPDILLFDEPLSNLDARLRLQVRDELRNLQKSLGITTIMVTHDQEEAMSVGDRLVLMRAGLIEQIGSAEQLYQKPASRFVADFIGRANFLAGTPSDGGTFTTNGGVRLLTAIPSAKAKEVLIRPEALRLSRSSAPSLKNNQTARIKKHVFLGGMIEIDIELSDGQHLTAITSPREVNEAGIDLIPESAITISVAPEDVVPL